MQEVNLRSYQVEAIRNVANSWRGGKKAPLLVLPTGAGKTFTFSYIIKKLVATGKTCWILVHRHNLALQSSQALLKMNIEHGFIGAGFSENHHHKVQIGKIGSLASRNGKPNERLIRLPKPDYIITDEAHHATAGTWLDILNHFKTSRVLGVTATPERLDGKMLGVNSGGFFDDLIIGPSIKDLVLQGHLMYPKYYNLSNFVENKISLKSNGDFDDNIVGDIMSKPQILRNVVANYRKLCDKQSAIVFCCSVKHADEVAEEFNQSGYNAVALTGNIDFRQQQKILEKLATGEINVVTSCEIISEGTDIPDVSVAILCRPTWSLTLYLQQVGRVLRVAKDKRPKYVLDMCGNFFRHGHPLIDRAWRIEGERVSKKKRKKEQEENVDFKQCPHCFACFETKDIKEDICPECGMIIGTQQRKLNIIDGQLVEVVWDDVENEIRKWHEEADLKREKAEKKKELARSIHACKSYEEVQELGRQKGYKTGWAWVTWDRLQKQRSKKV